MTAGRLLALTCALFLFCHHGQSQSLSNRAPVDPCATIANKTWVSPAEVRACFTSFPVNQTEKANVSSVFARLLRSQKTPRLILWKIIEVVNKTLAFHASVNYQRQAPVPFARDVHTDILGDLARIDQQSYTSDFDLHLDISLALRRLNDNHCVYINQCYDCECSALSRANVNVDSSAL